VPRLPRVLRLASYAVLAAWVLYLIAGNLFLNTALGPQALNRHPERLQLQWRRALTLYPGQIQAWDLRIDAQVRRLRWHAQAERAGGRIALWPLLRRELRLPRIDAEQVAFALQSAEHDLEPRPPTPDGWRVDFAQIRTDSLRSLQWDTLAIRGAGHARFAMTKQLRGGAFEILPSQVGFHAAELHRGEQRLLDELRLDAQFQLDPHRPDQAPGAAKLGLLRAAIELEATAPALGLSLGPEREWTLALQPGAGRIDARLALERGELARGGRLVLQLPVSVEVDGAPRRDNTLDLELAVDEGLVLRALLPQQPGGHARLDAELRVGQRRLPFEDWPSLLPQSHGHVDLRWRFDSLSWLSKLLVKRDWLAFDGAGELDADLKIAAGQLAPGSRFEIPAVAIDARVLDDRIAGTAHARGEIVAPADGGLAQARVRLALERFSMRAEEQPDAVYVEGRALTLDLVAPGDLAHFRDALQARLRFDAARVPALSVYNRYLPHANLRFTRGSGTLSGDLALDADGEVAHGRLGVQARDAGLRFAHLDLGGDVAIDARLVRGELATRRFDLDGTTLALRNVRFRDAQGREQRDWWARIALPRAHAEWTRPLALQGEARIEMKDVGFLLALFAQKKKFPGWLARVVDAGNAEVRGQARLRQRSLVLDRLRAENQRFQVRARLRLEDAQAQGDLLVRWGVLALGVELAPQEREFHLLKATEWYESRPDLMRPRASGRRAAAR
jgi:hypothetical protein